MAENTKCETGLKCAAIQSFGDLCCQKLCVCADELDDAASKDLEETCEAGTQAGCCVPAVSREGEMFVPRPACGGA